MPDAAHHEDAKRERYSKMLYIRAVKKKKGEMSMVKESQPSAT